MEYLPPESFGGVYGVESDIWACGVILYILLSGTSVALELRRLASCFVSESAFALRWMFAGWSLRCCVVVFAPISGLGTYFKHLLDLFFSFLFSHIFQVSSPLPMPMRSARAGRSCLTPTRLQTSLQGARTW